MERKKLYKTEDQKIKNKIEYRKIYFSRKDVVAKLKEYGRSDRRKKLRKEWRIKNKKSEQERYRRYRSNRANIQKIKINARRNKIRTYGLSVKEHSDMLAAQNGVCAVCGDINHNGWNLAIDHDHKTGKVRGLLCNKCNTAIGGCRDNIYIIFKFLDYMMERG
jgi:hypothetical protein